MKLAFTLAAAAAALALAACDSGTSAPAATTAPASTAAPAAPASAPASTPATPAPAAALPGLSVPYATEADFVTGCVNDGKIDKTVCECVGKATAKELGQKGLLQWVWEGYVQRSGMGQVRAKKWFTENGMDAKAQQTFANAVGKCYVTQ